MGRRQRPRPQSLPFSHPKFPPSPQRWRLLFDIIPRDQARSSLVKTRQELLSRRATPPRGTPIVFGVSPRLHESRNQFRLESSQCSDAVNLIGDLWSGFWNLTGDIWNGFWDFVFSVFRFLWPSHHTWTQLMFAAVFILVILGIAALALHILGILRSTGEQRGKE